MLSRSRSRSWNRMILQSQSSPPIWIASKIVLCRNHGKINWFRNLKVESRKSGLSYSGQVRPDLRSVCYKYVNTYFFSIALNPNG